VSALVEVAGLRKVFSGRRGPASGGWSPPALDGVSFELRNGEVLGIVGESGSGKTTLARCLVRLVRPDSGRIVLDGEDLLGASSSDLRRLRRQFQLIYQDPYSSLNPRLTIGDAIAEPALVHRLVGRDGVRDFVADLLGQVGLDAKVATRKPSQLSGGQRQRVAIARALAARPKAIIADEPVSALDVSIQAQILNLFEDVGSEIGSSMIFIAHQLSVVAHISQRLLVMYLGRVVESGPTDAVLGAPAHPYTQALLAAHPSPEPSRVRKIRPAVTVAPAVENLGVGCRFRDRCPLRQSVCDEVDPPSVTVAPGRTAWCHFV
jgi:peptide/nickel transport system ATP-binding protein/oligopeptide transport system ATP-binding protein